MVTQIKMAAFQVFIEFAKQQEAEDKKDEEGNKNKYFTEKETDSSPQTLFTNSFFFAPGGETIVILDVHLRSSLIYEL